MKLNVFFLLLIPLGILLAIGVSKLILFNETPIYIVNATEFDIAITHGGYQPNRFTANEGDLVRFLAITTEPTHDHGITIDEYGINKLVESTSPSNPDVIEFIASKTGSFEIYCKSCSEGSEGGHPQLKATLKILPKSS